MAWRLPFRDADASLHHSDHHAGQTAVSEDGRRKKLGEYLLDAGLLNEDQLR